MERGKGFLCNQLSTGGWLSLWGLVSSQGLTPYSALINLDINKDIVKLGLTRRSLGCWPTLPPSSLPPCVCCSTPSSFTCMNGQCYFCSGCFWKALKDDTKKKAIAWWSIRTIWPFPCLWPIPLLFYYFHVPGQLTRPFSATYALPSFLPCKVEQSTQSSVSRKFFHSHSFKTPLRRAIKQPAGSARKWRVSEPSWSLSPVLLTKYVFPVPPAYCSLLWGSISDTSSCISLGLSVQWITKMFCKVPRWSDPKL